MAKRMNKNSRRAALIIGGLFFVVAGIILVVKLDQQTPAPVPEIPEEPDSSFELFEQRLEAADPDILDREILMEGLGENFAALIFREDITGDDFPEIVTADLIHLENMREIRAAGYEYAVRSFSVFSIREREYNRLLHITGDGMFNHHGEKLVDQVPAIYGYAFRIQTFRDEPYEGQVRIFEIAILDDKGALISDDLTIY